MLMSKQAGEFRLWWVYFVIAAGVCSSLTADGYR